MLIYKLINELNDVMIKHLYMGLSLNFRLKTLSYNIKQDVDLLVISVPYPLRLALEDLFSIFLYNYLKMGKSKTFVIDSLMSGKLRRRVELINKLFRREGRSLYDFAENPRDFLLLNTIAPTE